MYLSQAKTFGGIGAILSLIGVFFYGILTIVGIVFILIAVKYISDAFKEEGIFKDYLISFILRFVAIFVALASFFAILGFDIFYKLMHPHELEKSLKAMHVILAFLIAFIVLWLIFLIASIFLKRSYYEIAEKTGVTAFHTTGLLYLVGSATSIILIGLLIIFIAKIFEIIAFFSLPEEIKKSEANGI